MDVNSIFITLEKGKHFIEHSIVDGSNNDKIIIGHISEIENPSGLGRREFAISNEEDKKQFAKLYSEYLNKTF